MPRGVPRAAYPPAMVSTGPSQEAIDGLEQALLSFSKVDDAAAFAGVHRSTLWRWRKRGEELARDRDDGVHGPPAPGDAPYLTLHDVIARSGPAAKARALMEIRRAAGGYPSIVTTTTTETRADGTTVTKVVKTEKVERAWTAWAWLLERNHPREFALVNRTELTGANGSPLLAGTDVEGDEAVALRAQAHDLVDQLEDRRRRNDLAAARDAEALTSGAG